MSGLDLASLSEKLVCPDCKGTLVTSGEDIKGERQGFVFSANTFGYLDFLRSENQLETTTEEYAELQHHSGIRLYEEYVKPWLSSRSLERVLDVGCGVGKGITVLNRDGYEAYGVDLPNLSSFWATAKNDPRYFFCADATGIPFADGYFDAICSLGVVEHIGTKTGGYTLSEDYRRVRQRYAAELVRIVRPGGKILLSCPNKRFPLDVQHDIMDSLSPQSPVREYLWQKAHVNVHKPWGHYYLPSYSEVEQYFCSYAGAQSMEALPLKRFFGFSSFEHRALKPLLKAATFYIEHLPQPLRRTPLNPYILVEITK